MTRSRAAFAVVTLLFLAAIGGAAACADDASLIPCKDIPAGGCPAFGSNVCRDPSCMAVFRCVQTGEASAWSKVQDCPSRQEISDGGPYPDANPNLSQPDAASTGAPVDAASDRAFPPDASGGLGCAALQAPDCPLSIALACSKGSCCDCVDLFVCVDGGWDLWGACDGGALTQVP